MWLHNHRFIIGGQSDFKWAPRYVLQDMCIHPVLDRKCGAGVDAPRPVKGSQKGFLVWIAIFDLGGGGVGSGT